MKFNFKNKNVIIILLLTLLIASVLSFFLMEKNVEPFIQGSDNYDNFTRIGSNSNYTNKDLYKLNDFNKGYKLKTISSASDIDPYILPNIDSPDIVFIGNTNEDTIFDSRLRNNNIDFNMYKILDISDSSITDETYDISYNKYKLDHGASQISLDLSSSLNDRPGNINILFLTDLSGKVYDLSEKHMSNLTIFLDGVNLITNGQLQGISSSSTTSSSSSGSNGSSGSSASVGDIITNVLSGNSNLDDYPNLLRDYPYLLQYPSLLQSSNYYSPYYNNSFESIMSLPSDPLVNPNGAMNPLQYNESLFSPHLTPMMTKSMCKNLNVNTKVSEVSNNSLTGASIAGARSAGASSAGVSLAGASSAGAALGGTSNISSDGTTNNHPPCPPCGRCPEPNFECKKIPKYEQGYDNPIVPRAVLTDFSTFGM